EEFVEYEPVSIKKEKFSAKYEVREKLGQGRFGKVHRVTDRVSGREFAAKIMRALKSRDREAVSMEIDIMNQLRHPKLVQLIDAYSHGREIIMVMDLVAGGELFERVIDEDFELTEAACIKYMRQICHGVQFMERSQIVHLDLKPENIMCINKTGTQIKLIDFGLARKFNPKEVTRVMFGTPEFVAPEVINYDAIGFETDMWSVGVICYILLSGLSPFCGEGDAETLSNITAVQWDFEDEAFDQISDDAKDFISKLLVKGLKKRYNVNQALDHRWLKRDTNKMSKSKLNTKNLKRYLARRKWQKTGNAVRALGRLASLARLSSSSSSSSSSHGNQRESGKPEFLRKFDDIEVIEGSAAKFVCTVSGNPDPDIVWLVDGEPIKESRRFRMAYTEDNQCTLLIMDASEADEAEYTCKASNSMGESQHAAELIVITPAINPLGESTCNVDMFVEPQHHQAVDFDGAPVFLIRTQSKLLKIGATINFKCTIAGTPQAQVIWKKDDRRITSKDGRYKVKVYPGGGYCLSIKNCKLSDCGKFTCIAENERGIALCASFLNKDEGYFAFILNKLIEDMHSHHTLRINRTIKSDGGYYFCTASNSAGQLSMRESSCSVRLEVKPPSKHTPPSIKFGNSNVMSSMTSSSMTSQPERKTSATKCVTLNEGKNAKISLTVKGQPTPDVDWYKDGKVIRTGNRHKVLVMQDIHQLQISRVKIEDSGLYSIIATNAGGVFTNTLNIKV
uniref:Myosin light chain kinase, smooth muscle n=1 Tax=Ciona savignyi TaxID=51511 RepID=H2YHI9_CIOSA